MLSGRKVTAVIVAAGSSTRMGFDKLFCSVRGVPLLAVTVRAFDSHPLVDRIVLVAGENEAGVRALAAPFRKVIGVVRGGDTRFHSVCAGVACAGNDGLIAIHDGARPFVSEALITRTLQAAAECGAAAPAVGVTDTIKQRDRDGFVLATVPRSEIAAVQTPQVFDSALFSRAARACRDGSVTDDCSVMELAGRKVRLVEGEYSNIKITTPEDLVHLGMENEVHSMRVGHGYDVHRLTEGRRLVLGGVEIPFEKGLLGHSDADVLLHAVMDALLGAAALGDIGQHFPDADPAYEGADSLQLLRKVCELVSAAGYGAVNIDATVLCQAPKLSPHIPAMRARIAAACGMGIGSVSVKATTEEGLGFTGTGEGIAAHAVCLLEKKEML